MPSPSNLYFGYDGEKTRALRCGLRAFETSYHKWGYMDEKCQVVLQPQWDKVRDFSEGYARGRSRETPATAPTPPPSSTRRARWYRRYRASLL